MLVHLEPWDRRIVTPTTDSRTPLKNVMSDIPVFTRIDIAIRTLGDSIIAWELHPMFKAKQPFTFTVQASRSGVGDWVDVAVVIDTCIAVDPNRWLYGVAPHLWYKVILTDDDGHTYDSAVKQMVADFNRHDLCILHDILRKENLRNTKYAGQHGFLLKRRRWGEACPACLDWDTDEVKTGHCVTCYGTGFVGGYFVPIHYWVSPSEAGVGRRTTTNTEGQGVIEDRIRRVRGTNCPWLDTGDVWIESNSDQRYIVQAVKSITLRDLPVIFDPIELRLAPATDVVYTLPLVLTSSSSDTYVADPYQGNPVVMLKPRVRGCNCR